MAPALIPSIVWPYKDWRAFELGFHEARTRGSDATATYLYQEAPGIGFLALMGLLYNPEAIDQIRKKIASLFTSVNLIGNGLGISRLPTALYPSLGHAAVANSSNLTIGHLHTQADVSDGAMVHVFFNTKPDRNGEVVDCHLDLLVHPHDSRDGLPFQFGNSINHYARDSNGAAFPDLMQREAVQAFDPDAPKGHDQMWYLPYDSWSFSPVNTLLFGLAEEAGGNTAPYDAKLVIGKQLSAAEFRSIHQLKCLAEKSQAAHTTVSLGHNGDWESTTYVALAALAPNANVGSDISSIKEALVKGGTTFYRCDETGRSIHDFFRGDDAFKQTDQDSALQIVKMIDASEGLNNRSGDRLSYNTQNNRIVTQEVSEAVLDALNTVRTDLYRRLIET